MIYKTLPKVNLFMDGSIHHFIEIPSSPHRSRPLQTFNRWNNHDTSPPKKQLKGWQIEFATISFCK